MINRKIFCKSGPRPVEALKLVVGPEKVMIFGQCGPEKVVWPAG